ncbi:MAG: hypothetical protein AB7T06_44780 [Kofleriaceae bacterium]
MRRLAFSLMFVAVGCASDGSSDPDLDSYDPRCVTACTDEPPSLDGAGDVCNAASRTQCLDTCQARVTGVSSVCASCLTEEACFDPGGCDGDVVLADQCSNTTCTRTGRNGSCTYPVNDTAARDNCERQVNPRREVACTAEFPSVQSCASVCQM